MLELTTAASLCVTAAGLFLMTGLVTGIWKYRYMLLSESHTAPVYVNTAHRAALMYAFACLVLGALAAGSAWPEWVNVASAVVPMFFFAAAVVTYIILGRTQHTDNQFRHRTFHTTWGMLLLILGEIGGVLMLLIGFIRGVWLT